MNELNSDSIVLLPLGGMEWMAKKISEYLKIISNNTMCEIISVDLIRFATGDAKAVLQDSIRGKDVFILVDVGNRSCKYSMFGIENVMSPDEHFQDLIRTISAIGGKAARVNVVMPQLYGARQDRRISRESLDCAVALQHLEQTGVKNVMSFDVHDDRVQNATPFMGFDNLMPTYQMLKAICRDYTDLVFNENSMAMVSPDFGGMSRNLDYANELGIDLGVFYKRRNYSEVSNGKNEILIHKYIGPDLQGKDVIIVDDVIASGESLIDSVKKIKELGAKRVFAGVTFGFFTNGIDIFNEAYEKGMLDALFVTNASYRSQEVLAAPWYKEVNVIKYIAFYIYSVNSKKAVSKIMDPHQKIVDLLDKYKRKY